MRAREAAGAYIRAMRTLWIPAVVLCAATGFSLPASAGEHVTFPAGPGQQNKEAVVEPGGTLKQASCGRVLQGEPAQRSPRPALVRTGPLAPGADPAAGNYSGAPTGAFSPPPPPDPTGPALVEAAFLTLRGTLTDLRKETSVTILDRNGRSRTVPLARGARIDAGLKAGDLVSVRIPLEEDPTNKAASLVERQKSPGAAPTSKFSRPQAGGM